MVNRNEKKKEKEKFKKNYRTSQNIRIINVFLGSQLSASFPSLGVSMHLASPRALQHCAGLGPCCVGSSDSNLVLLLPVLASKVHSCQSWCDFFCGSARCPFIYSETQSLPP